MAKQRKTLAQSGPRIVGGRYFNGYWAQEYTVTAVELIDGVKWITCAWHPKSESTHLMVSDQWDETRVTRHCTPWDARRDQVL
jgi:hypothetical protein